MVGSLGGCFIQLVFVGKYMEGLQKVADEKDTPNDAAATSLSAKSESYT